MLIRLFLIAMLSTLVFASCSNNDANDESKAIPKQKLVIAFQPTLAAADILEKSKPVEAFLESKLSNVDVEIYVPLSQGGVVEALRFGQAHVAFMGAWPAALAVDLAGAELALAEVREVNIDNLKLNETYYYSYWIVGKGSQYENLSQLKGKTACFPSAVSGSGYVGPMGKMIELGLLAKPTNGEVDPKKFFGEVIFGGGYSQCWDALKKGQVDVTIIAGDVPEALYNEALANSKILEKQGPLPSHAVLLSKSLAEPLRSQVVTAIEGLGAPEHKALMRSFISGIFVGFRKTDAETHLGAFRAYLDQSGLRFTERLGR